MRTKKAISGVSLYYAGKLSSSIKCTHARQKDIFCATGLILTGLEFVGRMIDHELAPPGKLGYYAYPTTCLV
jgi:hypothetical protein